MRVPYNVKLGSYLAILCITGKLTVYIEIDVGSNATEMSYDLLAIPVGRDVDDTAVRTYMVILGRNCWWLLVEMAAPAEAYVHIFRIIKSSSCPPFVSSLQKSASTFPSLIRITRCTCAAISSSWVIRITVLPSL